VKQHAGIGAAPTAQKQNRGSHKGRRRASSNNTDGQGWSLLAQVPRGFRKAPGHVDEEGRVGYAGVLQIGPGEGELLAVEGRQRQWRGGNPARDPSDPSGKKGAGGLPGKGSA
jgi:hypothetical protein